MPEVITQTLTRQEMSQMEQPDQVVSQLGFFVAHDEKLTVLAGLDRARVTANDARWGVWTALKGLHEIVIGERPLSAGDEFGNPLKTIEDAARALLSTRETYRQREQEHGVLRTAHEEWEARQEEIANPNVIVHFSRRTYAGFLIGAIQQGIVVRQAELARRREDDKRKGIYNPMHRALREVTWDSVDHIRLGLNQWVVPITVRGVADPPGTGQRPPDVVLPREVRIPTNKEIFQRAPPDTRSPEQRNEPHLDPRLKRPKSWDQGNKRRWWQF